MTKEKLYTICKGINDWMSTIPNVQEESLTDWLVYQITKKSDMKKPKMTCKTFSKKEEGRNTGADIELWILTDSGNYAYRIQAKKLSANAKKNADSLAYPKRSVKKQYDMLTKDAAKDGMTPLYMFYQKGHTGMLCPKYSKDCGAIITDASLYSEYAHKIKDSYTATYIVQNSYPLPCLLCFNSSCSKSIPTLNNGNLPDYVRELLATGTIQNENKLKSCKKLIAIDERKK